MKAEIVIPLGLESVLSIDSEVMHGALSSKGTRVPVTVLLDDLSEGMGTEEFLQCYPSVERAQVEAVVAWEHEQLRKAAGLPLAG